MQLVRFIEPERWTFITCTSAGGICLDEDRYLISTYGHIYDFYHDEEVKQFILGDNGYPCCFLESIFGQSYMRAIHRLVKMTFDYIPGCELLQVDHLDCNKLNPELSNLDWVTCQENNIRAHINNLCNIGENYYKSIFTNEEVKFICECLSEGVPIKDIANKVREMIYPRQYAALESVIYGILYRECWNSISKNYTFANYSDINFTIEEVEKICKMLEDNLPYNDILNNLGYTSENYSKERLTNMKKTITSIRNGRSYKEIACKYNIPKFIQPINFTNEMVERICVLIDEGKSNPEIFDLLELDCDIDQRRKYIYSINDIRRGVTHKSISSKYNFLKNKK